ncbi:MAG TPA: GDSL-type esterase/lipase family protein, partial [Solirubrobacteraceae bacterium]|nr:GDSL-type esterase/lipase family protein [Solirubrobacteraceae bacterium]
WRALPDTLHGEVITLLIGSNDILSPVHRRLLPEAMAELLAHLPSSAIVSAIPSPAPPARQANELIAAAAAAGRIRAVTPTLLGPASWRGKLASDRFHPNDAGYTMIAEVFAPAVREALARGAER